MPSIKIIATSRASVLRSFRATGKSVSKIKTLKKSTATKVGTYRVKYKILKVD